MLLTFDQVKSGPCSKIAGVCPTSPDFADYVNQAVRQLMRRGNWFASVQPIQGCVYDGCVTWPRGVETVLSMRDNGKYRMVRNHWYEFLPWHDTNWDCCRLGGAKYGGHSWPAASFEGTTPVFKQIPCGYTRWVLAYPSVQADVGKTTTIFGLDANGQVIRERNPDGTWSEGFTLTLAGPSTTTPVMLSKVTRVLNDNMQGVLRLYQWDGSTYNPDGSPNLDYMAEYQPGETSPDYLFSRLPAKVCQTTRVIQALVKLSFIPVVNDKDLVQIENQEAIAYFIQSIKFRENGDAARAIQWEKDSFRELNYQLRDRFPDEQFVVSFNPFGVGAGLNRVTSGMI